MSWCSVSPPRGFATTYRVSYVPGHFVVSEDDTWASTGSFHLAAKLTPSNEEADRTVFVRAAGGSIFFESFPNLVSMPAPGFWIDRNDTTSAEYQAFVDAGGYEHEELWQELELEDAARAMSSFTEAMSYFVDSTGRPGPHE